MLEEVTAVAVKRVIAWQIEQEMSAQKITKTAKGMSQLSRDTGLGRESLYKALSGEGNPSFATILKVTAALGIHLHAQPATIA